ncbi:hypothetical protein GH714_033437 [Hevea brasiliensis]|uniref:Glutathione S-transferase n=1 Tax=Hevea brasiliensis TaxID=3981 RepID=A0A6A6M5W5_HEVBR|nr:hypothetical protein GH714_033437 [Hevea brasiliensis]
MTVMIEVIKENQVPQFSKMAEIKLLGLWASPYDRRVLWALKLKGIPYEYVEEDLSNKSPLLLQYNPVHQKIPVLVHGGKPICESVIILEYLDETWPENPLLPSDPYERAVARFWVKFIEDKLCMFGTAVFISVVSIPSQWGRTREAVKDSLEMLKTIEEHALGEKKYFGGDKIGMVDIACGAIVHWLEVIEEVVGIKILEPHKFPRLHAWTKNFEEAPIIKDNLPDRDQMLVYFKQAREKSLAST